MKRLVITADDFGLAPEVNDAVEHAHLAGVLSAASLMVGAAATEDAVARARRLPRLRVGLHLVLVEGQPVTPAAAIPNLVDAAGRLRTDLAAYGVAIATRPAVRRQIRSEIRAQFEAFRATGLALDHVSAHQHYHLHPTIATELLDLGRQYGMKALRAPFEPTPLLNAVEQTPGAMASWLTRPWTALLRARARAAGLVVADRVFGLAWSGAMTQTRLAGLIAALPPGRTEIYTHPATASTFSGAAAGYRYREELSALLSPLCADALRRSGGELGGYGDFAGAD